MSFILYFSHSLKKKNYGKEKENEQREKEGKKKKNTQQPKTTSY